MSDTRSLALDILTDPLHWDCFTSWMRGWPRVIYGMCRKHRDKRGGEFDRFTYHRTYDPEFANTGFIPEIAIPVGYKRAFRVAHKLTRSSTTFAHDRRLSFGEVMWYAIKRSNGKVLLWVFQEMSTDPK